MLDPESPAALRDLQKKKQQPIASYPKTWGGFLGSLVDTALASPLVALALFVNTGLIITFTVILIWDASAETHAPSNLSDCLVFLIIILVAKLAFFSYLFWAAWERVILLSQSHKEVP